MLSGPVTLTTRPVLKRDTERGIHLFHTSYTTCFYALYVRLQQLTWHVRWKQQVHKVVGNSVFLCMFVCCEAHRCVWPPLCESIFLADHFLLHICHHNSAERRRDQSGTLHVTVHKRQDGRMNEEGMHWNVDKCVAWKMDGLMDWWFKWQEKWQMLSNKCMDWQMEGQTNEKRCREK